MIRRITLATFALLIAAPLSLQAQDYQMRLDRSTNAADPDDVPNVTLTNVNDGVRITTGPAVVLWDDSNTADGTYTLSGTFTLLEPSGHRNSYGLVFGGRDLAADGQNYLYFLVDQEGMVHVNHRANTETVHQIRDPGAHDAVATPGSDGRSVNELEVRVGADEIAFVVNGTVVHTQARQGMAGRTDGIWGARVNHLLNIEVTGLGVSN